MVEIVPNVKTGKKKGDNGLFGIRLNEDKTKHSIVFVFSKCKEAKMGNQAGDLQWADEIEVLEREPRASL